MLQYLDSGDVLRLRSAFAASCGLASCVSVCVVCSALFVRLRWLLFGRGGRLASAGLCGVVLWDSVSSVTLCSKARSICLRCAGAERQLCWNLSHMWYLSA